MIDDYIFASLKKIKMKKIFTSILMVALCSFVSAQNVLNVDGVITNPDGAAQEGILVSLFLESVDQIYSTESDEAGYYEFAVDLEDDATQGCFQVFVINCTFEPLVEEDCYNPGNTDFTFDFIFCENGTDVCFSYIVSEIQDSSLILSTIDIGLPPFTYVWSDGSTDATLTLPLDDTGEYCVTVTDGQGCESVACVDLTPPDLCFVNIFEEFDFNFTLLIAEGYGQTDELEYVWSTGTTGQLLTITESGEYCVTMTDGLGCESVDCGYFEVDTTWTGDCFSYIYSNYQDSVETLFVETFGESPFTYVWTFGDEVVGTSESYVPTETGVYCVEVTDANGCVSESCYDYFVWEECGVWVSCDPVENGIQLWAFGYGAEPLEYVWSTGDVGQELIVTESGEYCVTITDAEGCSSSACMDVDTDVSECFAPIEIIEFPDYAELTVNPPTDGEYEFYWNTGESTQSITVDETGTYCIEVVELETGCTFTTCATVYIGGGEECWGWIDTEYSGDSSAVLTIVAFDITSDSTGFQYTWSTGEATESIEVFEEGEYCVTVTGANGCEFDVCTEVIFWDFPWQNSIFGVVYETESGEPISASVDIYLVADDGSISLYSEGNETLEAGFFVVENVESGNYIALATAEEEGYVPTYGHNTTSWESATIYEVGDNTSVIPLEIAIIPITNLQGSGTIEGSVSTTNLVAKGKTSSSRNGTPLENANVMLMHSEIPVGQIFTNDEGHFKFTGLPYGTYNVVLEIPGLPQEIIEVVLSEENNDESGIEFEVDNTATSTNNISTLSSLTLSPNPTSNTLVVDTYFEEATSLTYRIIDINGRIIESSTFNATVGENKFQLDVTAMNNGVYNLVLQSKEELVTKRFIKM